MLILTLNNIKYNIKCNIKCNINTKPMKKNPKKYRNKAILINTPKKARVKNSSPKANSNSPTCLDDFMDSMC